MKPLVQLFDETNGEPLPLPRAARLLRAAPDEIPVGPPAYSALVVGNKGALGHAVAAGGALELIGCVLTLRDRIVPPTINYRVPDPECDLDYANTGPRKYEGDLVIEQLLRFRGEQRGARHRSVSSEEVEAHRRNVRLRVLIPWKLLVPV